MSSYEEAMQQYNKGLSIAVHDRLLEEQQISYSGMGDVMYAQGKYTKALECYQQVPLTIGIAN